MDLGNIEDEFFLYVVNEMIDHFKFDKCKSYIQHGDTTVYEHSVNVAYFSYIIAKKLSITKNLRSLILGALLHDYFLYDWHDRKNRVKFHGFMHPYIALKNVKAKLDIEDITRDIIVKHMFPLTIFPPRYIESWIVVFVDKICAIYEIISTSKVGKLFDVYGFKKKKLIN